MLCRVPQLGVKVCDRVSAIIIVTIDLAGEDVDVASVFLYHVCQPQFIVFPWLRDV